MTAYDTLQTEVQKVLSGAQTTGSIPVNLVGFSRGTGAAIEMGNRLIRGGMAPENVAYRLVDPYVGENYNAINPNAQNVLVYRGSGVGMIPAVAPIFGFGRDIFRDDQKVPPTLIGVGHTSMDKYGRGALDEVEASLLGRY